MKKNTDFANSERRIFISKTCPRLPRHRPPLFDTDRAHKSWWFVTALVLTLGLAVPYAIAAIIAAIHHAW